VRLTTLPSLPEPWKTRHAWLGAAPATLFQLAKPCKSSQAPS